MILGIRSACVGRLLVTSVAWVLVSCAGRAEESNERAVLGGAACEFPEEADEAMMDRADVRLRVAVDANGFPKAVQISGDPGFGFARAATRCAMSKRYVPAKDAKGAPISVWTPTFAIRFARQTRWAQ
ncbi:MAG: energy transducer TonB [Polyangiaceae bacterium]